MPLFSMWESLCIFGLDRERKAISSHGYSSVCRGLFVVLSCSVVSNSSIPWTIADQVPLSMGLSRQEYWSGLPCPPAAYLPNPGIEPRSPTLQVDSLSSKPSRKPKNTGVGNLALLQRIFLTQELNWGLLHCRQIFKQLSCQGSPRGLWAWLFPEGSCPW